MKYWLTIALLTLASFNSSAENNYRITLVRATPGSLLELIKEAQSYKSEKNEEVSIMRHSQGDHWDLMLLEPAGKKPLQHKDFSPLVDFQHTFLAKSEIVWNELHKKENNTGLFHIEMFKAKHGKARELLKQRRMENNYLTLTQRKANIIFETTFGSDVDSFTIGYYKDLLEFAQSPDLAAEVFSKAAINAGFKSRDDIGLYLRELIVSHNDTLATRVN